MKAAPLDLSIIAAYVIVSLLVGIVLSRRATKSVDEYFVGGRSMPWWLAGTSMIASAFAIDTPFGITGMVAKHGIQGVWFAWAYAIGGAGTFGALIFAALLRRSRVVTPAELIELRYSGRLAAVLRGFKAVYFGILSIAIIMGWVLRSVVTVSQEALGWDVVPTLVVIMLLTLAYTTVSGFWGVAVTDFFQFILGSIGSVLLAVFAVKSIGGIGALKAGLAARYGTSEAMRRLQFVPRPGERFFETFMVFVTLKWWGNPPSSLTQRILAAKDERHATFSMMLFAVVHFALNYWPMIIVGLVSFVMHPYLPADKAEQGYAIIMMDVLPTGVLGLALASMVAAFMSTIDTYVNGGASFMVNDLYRRFIKKGASEAHYVRASQVSSVLMLALGLLTFYGISSVKTAWEYLATMTAGYGIIAVARWFWWRINAEAEFASLAGSAIGSLIFNHMIHVDSFGLRFLAVALVSSATWIITALATPPSEMESLAKFCRVVRPYPLGWKPVRERYPDIEWSPRLGRNVILWFVGLVTVFSVCFGVGQLLLGSANIGGWMLLLAIFGGAIVARYYRA